MAESDIDHSYSVVDPKNTESLDNSDYSEGEQSSSENVINEKQYDSSSRIDSLGNFKSSERNRHFKPYFRTMLLVKYKLN
jgi:hypothetical protein